MRDDEMGLSGHMRCRESGLGTVNPTQHYFYHPPLDGLFSTYQFKSRGLVVPVRYCEHFHFLFLIRRVAQMDPLRLSLNPNKQLKEEFVSNLTGSSMLEIASLSTIVPILMVLRHWNCTDHSNVISLKKKDDLPSGIKIWRDNIAVLLMDFLWVILPILSAFTVLSDWANLCAAFLISILLIFFLVKRYVFSSSYRSKEKSETVYAIRSFVSSYRVSMMIVTCLCILAVDFKIYPRRYAKTETYGTGLMDLGVGSFVVANALVSRQARNVTSVKWKDAIRSVSPLLLLGIARLIFTAGVDYQVHVGEYGVHWNFFFTLAAISLLTSILSIHSRYSGLLGILILIGYQIFLMCGLNNYLLSNERTKNIVSQNKEGLFSIFGYWGMYLIGVQLGNHLFFAHTQCKQSRSIQWTRMSIWIVCILFWLMTIFLDKFVERVSRRMCNLGYVTFVLAQNFQVLAILSLSDLIPGSKLSLLEEAFNRNLLGLFVLANILTGVINLTVDTLSASPLVSFFILVLYTLTLSLFGGFALLASIRLKFW
ncbi:hypothetical protein H6P81_012085 [Aristolochia fimbriata]|uniref:GPI-anchored wall transfer protein n=1 Tax=Aristolochia fimbriata TaxID=158543 RepID=A0AAV7EAR5_ARIFI|nr:hypothetical protein H6P81_012085 [Aristolochia fimbriata]